MTEYKYNDPPKFESANVIEKFLSRVKTKSAKPLTEEQVVGFRHSQKVAFECAQAAAAELRQGWTEGQTQAWMATYLRDNGVKTWLHKPIVAFGERTLAPDSHWGPAKGKGLTLQENDVAILDCAPIVNGFTGDIAYTIRIGENPALEKALNFLAELRTQIPAQFANPKVNIFEWITDEMRKSGYQNAAGGYVGNIFGHRVYQHGKFASSFPYFLPEQIFGYMLSWHSPGFLLKVVSRLVFPEELDPFHNGSRLGIWAIEPHVRVGHFWSKI